MFYLWSSGNLNLFKVNQLPKCLSLSVSKNKYFINNLIFFRYNTLYSIYSGIYSDYEAIQHCRQYVVSIVDVNEYSYHYNPLNMISSKFITFLCISLNVRKYLSKPHASLAFKERHLHGILCLKTF